MLSYLNVYFSQETETKVEESSPLRMELSPHKNTLDYFEPDNPLVKVHHTEY